MKRGFTKLSVIGLTCCMLAAGTAFAGEADQAVTDATVITIPELTSQLGSFGEDVQTLQEGLIALGFLNSVADGSFGPMTREAVSEFQRTYGIPVTGEADDETLEILTMIGDGIATAPEDHSAERTLFRNIILEHYGDGKYYVAPNTVSTEAHEAAKQALAEMVRVFQQSTEYPASDIKVLVHVNADGLPETVTTDQLLNGQYLDLMILNTIAIGTGSPVIVTDLEENEITITADGDVYSNTDLILAKVVDYDDLSNVVKEEASRTIEETFATELLTKDALLEDNPNEDVDVDVNAAPENETEEIPEDSHIYRFRGVSILDSGDQFYVKPGTVSEQTLNEFRKAYTEIRYMYLNSTEIPEDQPIEDEAILRAASEVTSANNPEGEAQEKTSANSATTAVSKDSETQKSEQAPSTSSSDQTRIQSSSTTAQPTSAQPAQPATSWQSAQPAQHQHNWVAQTIHHDAVTHTETVHHDAITHDVWHDAVYQTVHHDAVTHEEPIYETIVWTRCGRCGALVDLRYMTKEEFENWCYGHGSCPGGGSLSNAYEPNYENIIGYETVTDSEAWDEQICTAEAWIETVIDTPAWDENVTVTDTGAWDEIIYTCSECGAIQ